jgi:predicted nucleic acid-binding protein
MKMMDAIIASTVLVYDIKLMSLNRKDFIYLDGIELV